MVGLVYLSEFNKAHSDYISSLNFNPKNDNILASACKYNLILANDRYVKLWNLNENNIVESHRYKIHLYGINQIKWNTDGNLLGTAGNDCNINIIDVERQKINRNFRLESVVTCIDFNYSSNVLLAGTYDNHIVLYDLRSKNLLSQILAHSEPITSVSFSGDSTVIMSSSYDGFCRLWDIFKGNCLKTIVLEKSPSINKACFLADMNYLLISSMNSQIQVMDLHKEEEVMKYTGHVNTNFLLDTKIVNFEDETFLISGSEDGCLYLWNVNENQPMKTLVNQSTINCLGINNQGVVATAGFPDINQSIRLYKLNI